LREILAVYPQLKILGSPWSAPPWMKTTNDFRGASLKPEFHPAYAEYFIKYIQGMLAEGIRIDAITVQNEPLHPGNNPSMLMLPAEQGNFIKNHLGPALRKAKLDTKIILYDHNCDRPDYPISILNDAEAKTFVDGSAFHLYRGKIDAMSEVHRAHPDKHLYFTEQWIGGPGNFAGNLRWHVENLIIGATRNWSRTVLEWNLTSDPQYQPHTDRGGCDRCLGGVTIADNKVTRNPGYYIVAHASKFVRPGSIRIGSSGPDTLPNVAFQTPQGGHVLIVLNRSQAEQQFQLSYKGRSAGSRLNPGAVATFVW
jgi:glucosylceramidase